MTHRKGTCQCQLIKGDEPLREMVCGLIDVLWVAGNLNSKYSNHEDLEESYVQGMVRYSLWVAEQEEEGKLIEL
jgi:hypothetical protein